MARRASGLTGWMAGLIDGEPRSGCCDVRSLGIFSFPFLCLYLTGGQLPYNVVLVSAVYQGESAINTHRSPLS